MDALVSVIIPVYKVEKYLERCLLSITSQEHQNLEIILVDDGSPDRCLQICEEWAQKDKRVTVLHKKNGGQSSARNFALMTVHGDYVCFVDSDDWVEKRYISRLLELLIKENADVSYCDFDQVTKEKKTYKISPKIEVLNNSDLMKLFFRVNGQKSSYAVWRGLYKKALLAGISFVEGIITEDVPFTYEVYKRATKAVITNEVLYHYFVNSTGITRSPLSNKDLVLFDIWDNIVNDTPGEYYNWAKLNRLRVPFTLYVKGMLRGVDSEFDKENLKKWVREIKINENELKRNNFLDWKRKLLLFYIVHFK